MRDERVGISPIGKGVYLNCSLGLRPRRSIKNQGPKVKEAEEDTDMQPPTEIPQPEGPGEAGC